MRLVVQQRAAVAKAAVASADLSSSTAARGQKRSEHEAASAVAMLAVVLLRERRERNSASNSASLEKEQSAEELGRLETQRNAARARDRAARKESSGLATKVAKAAVEHVGRSFLSDRVQELEGELEATKESAEDRVAELEEKLAALRRSAASDTADAKKWRDLRLPKRVARAGGGLEYDADTHLTVSLLMATGGSAPVIEAAWRIVVARTLGESAIEGADFTIPGQVFFTRKRMQNACIDESMVGRQLAAAHVIDQVGCDETGLNGVSMQASFAKVDGRRFAMQAVQVSKTGYGTAACVEGTFDRVRGQYAHVHAELGPSADLPAPCEVSLAKVASTMNDGTGAALVGAQEIEKLDVRERRKLFMGTDDDWDELPDEEKSVYKFRCNNHRRVLIVAEYQREEQRLDSAHEGLRRSKASGDVHWRMTDASLAAFLRSLGKLAVGQNKKDAYAKGDNMMMFAWAQEEKGDFGFANMGRLELGSRFDWICRAAFGAFYNFDIFYAPYLDLHLANTANVLRDALTALGGSIYVKAKLFVSAVIYDKLMNPFNALVNSKKIGLSITDLAAEYDAIRGLDAASLLPPAAIYKSVEF